MEVAVTRVEDVADAQAGLVGQRLDPPEHLTEPSARHDAVLDVVVGRDAAHRREGALAALPEHGSLGVVVRDPHLEGAGRAAEPVDLGPVLRDLGGDAVELDEEHRGRALRIAGMERGLRGLDRQPVHHLDRRRDDPRGDHRRHRLAARLEGAEGGEHRRDDLRHALDAQRHLHGDPERPLGSDEHPEQVGAVLMEALPAELDELTVGEHHLGTRDVVDREAVLEAVRSAGVLGDVPADRADLLARRVGCVEEAVGGDRAGDVEVRHARLDDDPPALDVDLDDPVHPRQRDDDPVGDGEASPGEPCPGTPGHERDACSRAGADDRLHLVRAAGEHDRGGDRPPAGQPVAVVRRQLLGRRQHVRRSDGPAQTVEGSRGQGHGPSLSRYRSSMIWQRC